MSSVAESAVPTVEQPLVSQPDNSALFMATRSNLRLVWESIRTVRDAEGVAVDKTPGKTVEFREGVLRVPLAEDGTVPLTNGEAAPAAEVLRFLERHRLKGDWLEGFWRVDPTAPPPSEGELEALQSFAIELNADGLREFLAQESNGWNRRELLTVAAGTLERVEGKLREIAAQMEAARKEGAAEARKAARE